MIAGGTALGVGSKFPPGGIAIGLGVLGNEFRGLIECEKMVCPLE